VDRREVLRQHDAALQLRRALVAAAGQVQRAAGAPEARPVALGRRQHLLVGGQVGGRLGPEGHHQLDDRLIGGDQELVRPAGVHLRAR
jgi:hypothetical protein